MFTDPRKIADSTTTPLAAEGSYVGPWVDALKYRRVAVAHATDSATTTVRLDQSVDGTLNGIIRSPSSAAGLGGFVSEEIYGRYVRLAVLAGATPQTRLAASLILS